MPPAFELLSALVRFRADVIIITVLAIVACHVYRMYLRQHDAAQEFSAPTCFAVITVVLAGALLAEWIQWILGYPAPANPAVVALARAVMLGTTALIGAVLLITAARLARLRVDLRVHA